MSIQDFTYDERRAIASALRERLVGERIRAVRFSTEGSSVDDNLTVPPGTEGTVGSVDDFATLHVRWDNGARLGVLYGEDRYEVLTATPVADWPNPNDPRL